jgi:osmotically-inducible protein OsmY
MKALSPLAIILSALLLQGCVAAAVVGTAAVGTKAATDPRTVGTQVDDSTLELRVNSALSKDEQIKKQARINVTAYQGKVLLTGQSPVADLSARAKQIAMGVEGTTEVFNEVRQGQPIGLGTASSDTWITTKVRSQLLGTDQVKSSNVKVTTENGEVFLMGLVTDREGRGGRYRQPGQRRVARDHRLYLYQVSPLVPGSRNAEPGDEPGKALAAARDFRVASPPTTAA